MTVHSTQLGSAHLTTTAQATLYTVPAGRRTILKGVTARNKAATAKTLNLAVYNSGGTELVEWNYALAATGTTGDSVNDTPWAVLNAGDVLKAATNSGGDVYVMCSGAELGV